MIFFFVNAEPVADGLLSELGTSEENKDFFIVLNKGPASAACSTAVQLNAYKW